MYVTSLGPIHLEWDESKNRHLVMIPGRHPLVYRMQYDRYQGRYMDENVQLACLYHNQSDRITLERMMYCSQYMKKELIQRVSSFIGEPDLSYPEPAEPDAEVWPMATWFLG